MGYFADYMDVPDDAYPSVPDHIDPFTGNFKLGTRKCSKCKAYKTRQDFNGEQEKKPASRRICNACGPPMPADLNAFTIPQIKDELRKRGVGYDAVKGLKKAELVGRLQAVLDQAGEKGGANAAAPVATSTSSTESTAPTPNLTRERILAFKAVDLKRELKARGRPVSGLKAVLQERLLAEISPNDDVDDTSSEKKKATAKAEVETTKKVTAEVPTVPKENISTTNSSGNKENSPEVGTVVASSGNIGKTTTSTKQKKVKFYAVAVGRKPGIY